MLVATEALRPPKLRIGKLGNNFTLPRTVSAVKLLTGAGTALIFITIFATLVGWSVQSVMYSATIGALVGVGVVSYSPLKDESLARWFGLKVRSRKGKTRTIKGRPVRLAVGICYVEPPVKGAVQARPGAIPVRAGAHDDRGVRIQELRWRLPVVEDTSPAVSMPSDADLRMQRHRNASSVSNVAAAMDAWRAAASEPGLPEDFLPSSLDRPARSFGRWRQDPEQLRQLYREQESSSEELPGPNL